MVIFFLFLFFQVPLDGCLESCHIQPFIPGFIHIEFGVTHTLNSACDDYVGIFGLDHHARIQDRLQPRRTSPVQLITGHFDWKPSLEQGQAAYGRVFTAGIAMAQDYIVYLSWI